MAFDIDNFDTSGEAWDPQDIGDKVVGLVTDAAEIQATDYVTGALAFWDDGKPKMQVLLTIQEDGKEETTRAYLKGGKNFVPEEGKGTSGIVALHSALDKVEMKDPTGCKIQLVHSGMAEATMKGFNRAKLYMMKLDKPVSFDIDDLDFDD